ncbi:hypothetical protein AUQ48_02455 [Kocuria flava]|uniref:DUF262 domain-containing protein n=1 Tax=Kocuria flava TaxID=446860 RepID=A0A2N4SZA9_9MICC|nr:DUF262 domain-containing protein [Kocuria flava]PLC11317.1 hypothetical protein AUQ48_02455 [Kocuria flava]
MKANALSPRELFSSSVQYTIPPFQRPYVWSEEDQWEPLWQDIERVCLRLLECSDIENPGSDFAPHFLGAVVFKSGPAVAGDVTVHSVIDGQQRLTTLQIVLDAAEAAIQERGYEDEQEVLQELVLNGKKKFRDTPKRFKLWPSRADRVAFEEVMDGRESEAEEHRIVEAHSFFRRRVAEWVEAESDDGQDALTASHHERVRALTATLQDHLRLVAIQLETNDDDQVIFETLNDRGTPLLKADLIKNWVFQRAVELGADAEQWADQFWAELDGDWWREEIAQGRLYRSRIDIFIQYWLIMKTGRDIVINDTFRVFREFSKESMSTLPAAEAMLRSFCNDALTFRKFTELENHTPEGRFYRNVIEGMELAATTPVLLWMTSRNHEVPVQAREKALLALESWAIRRTLLRLTTKGVNRLMVVLLRDLNRESHERAAEVVLSFLGGQTSESSVWPSDEQMTAELPTKRLYGVLRQNRISIVLQAVERHLRSHGYSEDVTLPGRLEVEHLMPQGWRKYWDDVPPLGPEASAHRDALVNSLGNLTLVTRKLNGALSNRPWTSIAVRERGAGSGSDVQGKRDLIEYFTLLALNKSVVMNHPETWNEDAILRRSHELTQAICEVWPQNM